jgi:glycerol-3-phosphate O-acyltransferase / dihydroxyacetone phosphate acyltransferase
VNENISIKTSKATPKVERILSDTELEVKFNFDHEINMTGFQIYPYLKHDELYQKVWNHLSENKCIGIFPEGGSHDQPHLLPLKAGVTFMALGANSKKEDLNVTIIPFGLNYFSGHR